MTQTIKPNDWVYIPSISCEPLKALQERVANPTRDIDIQFVREQQILNQFKEKSDD